jgi:hypothetical protein
VVPGSRGTVEVEWEIEDGLAYATFHVSYTREAIDHGRTWGRPVRLGPMASSVSDQSRD